MNTNKLTIPLVVFLAACIVFVLILLGNRFVHINDKWSGTSNDKKWNFVLQGTDRKNYHIGHLYWNGVKEEKRDIRLRTITFKIGDKIYDEFSFEKKDGSITNEDDMTFLEGIQKEEINNKTITIYIKWTNQDAEHESHITLKRSLVHFKWR